MWLCLFSGWPFEDTFENARWGKVKQMQPMWLCLFSGRRFEETFENTQWGKVKQMQPVWLCLLCPKFFEETYEEAQCSVERRKGKSQHLSSSADARRECAHWKTYFSERKRYAGETSTWWLMGKKYSTEQQFGLVCIILILLCSVINHNSFPLLLLHISSNVVLIIISKHWVDVKTTLSSQPITPNMTNFAHCMSCRTLKMRLRAVEKNCEIQLRNWEGPSGQTGGARVDKLEAQLDLL